MNLIFLVLTLAQPQPAEVPSAVAAREVIAAERAFAARAQSEGQWTAFRATAAPDAIMLVPGPTPVRDFLARFSNDPAVAVMWWPARVWVSCDGSLAVTAGPWVRDGGTKTGTFTTVWRRTGDGEWRWVYDNGRDTPRATPAPDQPQIVPAPCPADARARTVTAMTMGDLTATTFVQAEGRMPNDRPADLPPVIYTEPTARGAARDATLSWDVMRLPERGEHAYAFRVWQREGNRYTLVLYDTHGLIPAQ